MSSFEIIALPQRGKGYLIENYIFPAGCSATAKIVDGLAYVLKGEHRDLPSELHGLKFKANLKEAAASPDARKKSLTSLYHGVRQKALDAARTPAERREIAASLPSKSSAVVAAHRTRVEHLPKNPGNLSEVDGVHLHQSLTLQDQTSGADRSFLLFDTGATDPNRMLIFGNKSTVERLSLSETLHIHFGSLRACTSSLLQFTHSSTLVLYVLLNGKSEQLYSRMFENIKEILNRFNVRLNYLSAVVSDFESGLIAAIRTAFPGIWHRGCFFHFSQSIYRSVVRLGYKQDYQRDSAFREGIRQFLALGHVPSAFKFQYYQFLLARYVNDPRIMRFAEEYFYPTWFANFALVMWDWYNVSVRTNNHVEGWHSGLKTYFESAHLQFYRFCEVLLDEEKKVVDKLTDRINGIPPPKPDPTYASLNQRIITLHSEFMHRLPFDYLLPLAHCCPKPQNIPEETVNAV